MNLKFDFIKRPSVTEIGFTILSFLFLIPQPYLTIPALDASWQVTLEEAFFKGWEFGAAINFTGGPLSFLYTPTSLGYYVFGQIAAESAVLLVALFLVYRALRNQAWWIKCLVFASFALSAATGKDGIFLISITAGTIILLTGIPTSKSSYLIPVFFSVLSLMKFSFATLSIACIAILSVHALLQNDFRKTINIVGSYVASFLLIWLLIGQNLLTIPGFFINSLQISQGYLWNMNLSEDQTTFIFLTVVLLLTSVPIFIFTLLNRKSNQSWFFLLIAAASIYLSWKAGITRAGSHMSFFLQASLIVTLLSQGFVTRKNWGKVWLGLIAVSYVIGLVFIYPGGIKPMASLTWKSLQHNLVFLVNPDSLNQTYTRIIPMVLAENELPQMKQEIREGSVDLLHFQQSVLLLNDFNFQPRPTIQNYPAYNEHLSKLNQQHIEKNPPDYILVRYATVDQRYPYSDDSLYNLEVFKNYRPLMVEKSYMLLKRTETPLGLVFEEPLLKRKIQSGENVDISNFSDQLLWLKVDYSPSFLHKLCAFFYKPEIVIMRVTLEDSTDKNFRLVGGNLKQGFLLNPLLEGDKALEDFLNTHAPFTKITSFTIASIPGNTFFPTSHFELELIALKKEATP